ncbi:MAG: hypothetical protein FWH27_07450 [Planctomycetaceae bacterium]|nr:hypothetical protein [Planctomycetaceae bacterium]
MQPNATWPQSKKQPGDAGLNAGFVLKERFPVPGTVAQRQNLRGEYKNPFIAISHQ